MEWSIISMWYQTELHFFKDDTVTATRHGDEVLNFIVSFYAAAIGPYFLSMDDNAQPHRANLER